MSGQEKDVAGKGNESRFFSRLKLGLKKTRDSFASEVIRVVSGPTEFGPELWQELEDVLLSADMGVPTMTWVMEALKKEVRESPSIEKEKIVKLLKELLPYFLPRTLLYRVRARFQVYEAEILLSDFFQWLFVYL